MPASPSHVEAHKRAANQEARLMLSKPAKRPSPREMVLARRQRRGSPHRSWTMAKPRRHRHHRFSRKHLLRMQVIFFTLVAIFALLPAGSVMLAIEQILGSETSTALRRHLETSGDSTSCRDTDSSSSGEFPPDFFDETQKDSGGILVHIFLIFYMFMGLAIVCDEYFESSLSALCEDLKLKEDVAGATFMAAGGSAPELFSSIIGVFVAKSDIGFGTIVGSATFNVLFVIAACAFVTNNLALSWWPLTRDCVFYCISIVVLVTCIIDQEIAVTDSVALLIMYCLYITVMYFNEALEEWVTARMEAAKAPRYGWRLRLENFLEHDYFNYFIYMVIIANIVVIFVEVANGESNATQAINSWCSAVFIAEMALKIAALSFFGYWHNPVNAFDGTLVVLILIEMILSSSSFSGGLRALRAFRFLRVARVFRLYMASFVEKIHVATQTTAEDWKMLEVVENMTAEEAAQYALPCPTRSTTAVAPVRLSLRGSSLSEDPKLEGLIAEAEAAQRQRQETTVKATRSSADNNNSHNIYDDDDDDDDDDDEPSNPFELPDGGPFDLFLWALAFPLSLGMFLTIPDCRRPIFKRFYMLTFLMCIVWIALLSYVMVWMATIFGEFACIPQPIMGLTLLAAGTSVPDLMSSIAVAKRGLGDMAVSSSVGSNIFDILIGLPVPWFIYTAIVNPGEKVLISSDGITIMVLTLFIMVAAVVSIIHWCNWVMTKKLGIAMMALYAAFVTESLILEML